MVRYETPQNWIAYDARAIVKELTEAKAAVLSLTTIPYQRSWVEKLQQIQLKREVAGTSRIEGAEFTEKELDAAMRAAEPAGSGFNLRVRLEWPTEITESAFFERVAQLPKAKTYPF